MGDFVNQDNSEIKYTINKQVSNVIDLGDLDIKESAYEKTDLVVAKTEKIVDKFVNDDGDIQYVERQLSFNAADEVIKTEILSIGETVPTWANTLIS